MLNLKYIILGELPRCQEMRLRENLSAEDGLYLHLVKAGRLCCDEQKKKEKYNADFIKWAVLPEGCPPEESLLISGDAVELADARALGMTTVCYLPPKPEGAVREPEADWGAADMYVEGFDEVDGTFLRRVYCRHHGIPWVICETERCVIKEFSMDYLDALFELYAGKGMTDYIEPLYDYEKEREYQQAYISRVYPFYGYGMWIVCDRKTGRLIGRAGVEPKEELDGELEIGYAIGVPYQRKGYGTEACAAVISYVKRELAADRLNCLIEEGNTVSERLAERLGFIFCGYLTAGGKKMKRYVLDLRCIS